MTRSYISIDQASLTAFTIAVMIKYFLNFLAIATRFPQVF